jgi:hypothetical protein
MSGPGWRGEEYYKSPECARDWLANGLLAPHFRASLEKFVREAPASGARYERPGRGRGRGRGRGQVVMRVPTPTRPATPVAMSATKRAAPPSVADHSAAKHNQQDAFANLEKRVRALERQLEQLVDMYLAAEKAKCAEADDDE